MWGLLGLSAGNVANLGKKKTKTLLVIIFHYNSWQIKY